MASVLNLQATNGATSASVGARSTVSVYRCGKDGHSTISAAWCFKPVVAE
jgi:hypothetical protein